jgi:soluble cytochrome b562
MREGDRSGGPSRDRELYDLPDLKERDGFTPGDPAPDRDGFAQGTDTPEKSMTGAEIKEMVEQIIDTQRREEKDQFKALDEARTAGADKETIEAMKAQVKDTIGDRLTAEKLSQSITPDMMNQSFNVGEVKENAKEALQKMQNAVQQQRDAHPGQGAGFHINHSSMDR